jgi:hypothetical protein
MKKFTLLLLLPAMLFAQEKTAPVAPKQTGKYDTNKFSQMYDLLATPNMFRTASARSSLLSATSRLQDQCRA